MDNNNKVKIMFALMIIGLTYTIYNSWQGKVNYTISDITQYLFQNS